MNRRRRGSGLQTLGEGYQRFESAFRPKNEGPPPKGKKTNGKPRKNNRSKGG